MARTLAIGYDGSDNAEDALVLGGVLATALGATPLVVSVLPYPDHLMSDDELRAALRSHSEPLFAAAGERLGGLDVEGRAIVDDSPAHALHEVAEAEGPLCVVIGATHRGPLGRVLLGSVGEALLSGAPCTIAVAPRGYASREQAGLLRIGVAIDGSPESQWALEAGASLARRAAASLALLAVAKRLHVAPTEAMSAIYAGAYEAAERERMSQALDRGAGVAPPGVPVDKQLLEGDPATAITEVAGDLGLLILGSRGYGPLRRALLGSVSAKLVRLVPCPVLVLPRAAGPDPLGLRSESAPPQAESAD